MFTVIPAGQIFYRARQPTDSTFGRWYAFDVESASRYGPLIGMYRTSRELRLVNIISFDFRKDYTDRLNMEYPGQRYDGDDFEKYTLMFPIGLPDLEKQKIFWQAFGQQVVNVADTRLLSLWNSFHGLSRASELNYDRRFSDKLQSYYGTQSDGWVCPIVPLNMSAGTFFHRELYVNDAALMTYINDVPFARIGGSLNKQQIIGPLNLFKSQEDMLETAKRICEKHAIDTNSMPIMLGACHFSQPPPYTPIPFAGTGGGENKKQIIGPLCLFKSQEDMLETMERLKDKFTVDYTSMPKMLGACHFPEPSLYTQIPNIVTKSRKTRKNRSKPTQI
jgi:hypothetical protein